MNYWASGEKGCFLQPSDAKKEKKRTEKIRGNGRRPPRWIGEVAQVPPTTNRGRNDLRKPGTGEHLRK